MHANLFLAGIFLPLFLSLAGCNPPDRNQPSGNSPGSDRPTSNEALPLSPGTCIASLNSGGIAGISHMVQVTHDWKLIVVADNENFVRRIDGDEQRLVNASLAAFGTLSQVESDDFPDGFSSHLVARGTGEGVATADEATDLASVLAKLKAAPRP